MAHDTLSILAIACYDQSGNLLNLDGFFVTLRWRYTTDGAMTYSRVMTKADQSTDTGVAHYQWQARELIAPLIIYDAVITDEDTGLLVTQLAEVKLDIRAKAEDPGASASPSSSPSPSPTSSPSASPSYSASRSPSTSGSASPSGSLSSSPSASRSHSPSASPSAS